MKAQAMGRMILFLLGVVPLLLSVLAPDPAWGLAPVAFRLEGRATGADTGTGLSLRSQMAGDRAIAWDLMAGKPAMPAGAPAMLSLAWAGASDDADGGRRIGSLRAIIYSAVLPGLGQLMQGSRTGYVFLAGEAVGWTGWAVYRGRGLKGEDDYRAYVDAHYSRAQYQAVEDEVFRETGCGPGTPGSEGSPYCQELANYLNLDEDTHSQHYYEDVGKLDKYIFGWLDWADGWGGGPVDGQSDYNAAINDVDFGGWSPGDPWPEGFPPFESGLRARYQDMRRSANHNWERATKFSWFLLLNRVGSAFHAGWLARGGGHGGESPDGESSAEESSSTRLAWGRGPGGHGVKVALTRRF